MNMVDRLAVANEERKWEIMESYFPLFDIIIENKDEKAVANAYDELDWKLGYSESKLNKLIEDYKVRKQGQQEQDKLNEELLNNLKEEILEQFKGNMVEEDFQDMFDKIKNWIDKNIKTKEDAEKLDKDPSALMEELGLYSLDDIADYIEETFKEDSDMMKGLRQSAMLFINGKNTIDEVIEAIYPVIKGDMESKEIEVPEYLVKIIIKEMLIEEKQKMTSVVKYEGKQNTNDNQPVDVDYEEVIEPITFDDSGLVEVKIINLNEDGETMIVRPVSEGTGHLVIAYKDLIQENNKTYIPLELLQQNNNFRDDFKEAINRIVSTDEFKLMMEGVDETKVRVDVEPTNDPNFCDKVNLFTEDKCVVVMLDAEGKFITKHSKVLVIFAPGDSIIALPITKGLFNDLLTKDKSEFEKQNILNEQVMQLSDKLDLSDIPVSSFNTVLNNILKNKSLRTLILNSDKLYRFDGKITSKKFTITDESEFYHYNNGKITKTLVSQETK